MINAFITSLALASPLLILIAIGYFLKRINFLSTKTSEELSRLVLNLILPVNIFMCIYDSDFKTAFNLKFQTFLIIINIIAVILSIVLSNMMTKDKRTLGALLQSTTRGNFSIFGLPLAISIYGNSVAAPMAIACGILNPIYHFYAISAFEACQKTNTNKFKQLLNVLKAPMTIATVLAILIKLTGISIPTVPYKTLDYISKSLTAISLINIGVSFNLAFKKEDVKYLSFSIIFKLVILPVLGVCAAALLGYRNENLVTTFAFMAVPTGLACFPTAMAYDTDVELTKSAIVYSHICCAITIPVILSVIKLLELI